MTRALVTLISLLAASHALYFHIDETERKCFIEEIPDVTMVIGNYKVLLHDPTTNGSANGNQSIGMHVEVKDPNEEVILSQPYLSEGRFTFTSPTPGEHTICLFSNRFTMHQHPSSSRDVHASLWIFGYGSLIWNPGFSYAERRKAHALGYARRMYQGNTYHRGDDTLPGRVATLVEAPTEDANGVVFRVEGTRAIEAALKHLNEREVGNGYFFKLVRVSLDVSEMSRGGSLSTDGSTTSYSDSEEEERREGPDYHNSFLALTCIAHVTNELYLGKKTPEEMAKQIAAASGRSGPNHEYLIKLAENIRALFPRADDRHLFGLEKRVREIVKRERRDTV